MALSKLTKVQTLGIGSNIEVVGVITTGQFKSGTSNLHSSGVELTNLNVSGIATIGGNLSIGGTLTYQDVTNIDSVGLITARSGINVSGGTATFAGDVSIADKIIHTGDENTSIRFPSTDTIRLETGGVARLTVDSNGNTLTSGGLYSQGDLYIADSIIHEADTNTKIRFPAADTIAFETSGYERFRITSGGVFGFNTNNPDTNYRFDFAGSARFGTGSYGSKIVFARSGLGDELVIGVDGYGNSTANEATIQSSINFGRPLVFATNNTERLRIKSDGKIGVNTPTPIGTLDVYDGSFVLSKPNASGNERNWRFLNNNVAAGNLGLQVSTAAGGSSFANLLEITKNGYIGIGEGTPDRRIHLKNPAQIKLESTDTGNWSGLEFMASSGTNNYDAYMGMNDSNGVFFIDNNSNGHDFIIDRDGRVTTPSTTSFYATANSGGTVSMTSTHTLTNWRLSTSGKTYDIGSNFNTSNGRFTAPVSGKYLFTASILLAGYDQASDIHMMWRKNGTTMQYWYNTRTSNIDRSGYGGYLAQGSTTTFSLSTNDYIDIACVFSGSLSLWCGDANWGHFSGHLLG